jgi:RNA recognition motif-containing protein
MAMKLFVGSLPFKMSEDELRELFTEFGAVASAKVITDRETGRSRGFGFVEYESDEEAKAAIDGLNGKDVDGRALVVSEARPQERRSFGGGNGGGFNRERNNDWNR